MRQSTSVSIAVSLAVLISSSAGAADQMTIPELISDKAMGLLAQKAAELSVPCEVELRAGQEGAGCETYRISMAQLNQTQIARLKWCVKRIDEGQVLPTGCNKDWTNQGRWPVIEALSRDRYPDHWRQVDALRR